MDAGKRKERKITAPCFSISRVSFRIPPITRRSLLKTNGNLAVFAHWLALCSHQPNIMQILHYTGRQELQNRQLARVCENDLNKGPVWIVKRVQTRGCRKYIPTNLRNERPIINTLLCKNFSTLEHVPNMTLQSITQIRLTIRVVHLRWCDSLRSCYSTRLKIILFN